MLTLLERAPLLAPRTSVEVALVSGEYLATAQRRRAREAFGVRMTQAYATADVGLIAYECPAQRGLHVSDRVAVEVLDPDTGEPGHARRGGGVPSRAPVCPSSVRHRRPGRVGAR